MMIQARSASEMMTDTRHSLAIYFIRVRYSAPTSMKSDLGLVCFIKGCRYLRA